MVVLLASRKSQAYAANMNVIADVTRVPLIQSRTCLPYVDNFDVGKCIKKAKGNQEGQEGKECDCFLCSLSLDVLPGFQMLKR